MHELLAARANVAAQVLHAPEIQVVQLAGQLWHVFVVAFRKVELLQEQLFVEDYSLNSVNVELHV